VNLRAVLAACAVAGATIASVPAEPARAACSTGAILGSVKAALHAATDVRVTSVGESEKQYQLMLTARQGLDAAPARIETECAGDGFHGMMTRETNTVYRAWNEALAAGRASYLAKQGTECRAGLRTVASGAVTNGWALLNRLYLERPHPDSYDTAHRLLLDRARDLGFRLPPLGDGATLAYMQHKNHWDSFSAGANLPPYCTRY
jgi:hypothetical protein